MVKSPPANTGHMGSVLVQEDPTCHGATVPLFHSYRSTASEAAATSSLSTTAGESPCATTKAQRSQKSIIHFYFLREKLKHRLTQRKDVTWRAWADTSTSQEAPWPANHVRSGEGETQTSDPCELINSCCLTTTLSSHPTCGIL